METETSRSNEPTFALGCCCHRRVCCPRVESRACCENLSFPSTDRQPGIRPPLCIHDGWDRRLSFLPVCSLRIFLLLSFASLGLHPLVVPHSAGISDLPRCDIFPAVVFLPQLPGLSNSAARRRHTLSVTRLPKKSSLSRPQLKISQQG